jgi:ABC-type multidrug transport system fused ATPase/permease subunit
MTCSVNSAHRLSTMRKSDKIIVLENGRIVEEEDHDDLIVRQGRHAVLADTTAQTAEDASNTVE